MDILLGIMIPFIGTTLGASMVFFMKNTLNIKIEKILLGFASGVMMAASVWSLLIPAIEMTEKQGKVSWIPAVVGFILGILFFIIIDFFVEKINKNNLNKENDKVKNISKDEISKIKNNFMLVLAVTIHNIPEGMSVGVIFAGLLSNNASITLAGAMSLAIGIAVQNFPEGAIISMPLKSKSISKLKSFLYGTLSGIVEPISAIITILLTNVIVPILPYLLSFSAGAMMYVVVKELIPESQKDKFSTLGIIGFSIGFIIMMILDITLG